jgi:hypothetical protein
MTEALVSRLGAIFRCRAAAVRAVGARVHLEALWTCSETNRSLQAGDEGTPVGSYPFCSMFFGSRKRRLARSSGSDSGGSDLAGDETLRSQARELRDWRESAQRVTRAWSAWLAADGPDRGWRYRAFEEALAEEERAAAEVERVLQLVEAASAAGRPPRLKPRRCRRALGSGCGKARWSRPGG